MTSRAKLKEVAAVAPESTLPRDIVVTDEHVTMSKRRAMLAFDAAEEVEQLCIALRCAVVDSEQSRAVRGISKRIEDMAVAIMGALDDDMHQTDDLASEIQGREVASCPA